MPLNVRRPPAGFVRAKLQKERTDEMSAAVGSSTTTAGAEPSADTAEEAASVLSNISTAQLTLLSEIMAL